MLNVKEKVKKEVGVILVVINSMGKQLANTILQWGVKLRGNARPNQVPTYVENYLVGKGELDPAFIWFPMALVRQKLGVKNIFEIMIFDKATAAMKGIDITDWGMLKKHPDLITYSG